MTSQQSMARGTPVAQPPDLLRRLQEHAARAVPARKLTIVDGWWLRHGPSSAWWAGSVLPHHDAGPSELPSRVADAERFYADHGAASRFQMTPGACPDGLDELLADRGYRRHCDMSLQLGSSARAAGPASVGSLPVRIRDRPTSDWLDVWQRVLGEAVDVTAELEMLSRVRGPSAYACARIGDDAVAVARAVAGDGWAGVFGMATMPAARGRGAAREVLASLARWARRHGAARMYLQVERDNSPALRLYERAGFREVCAYSYRSRRSG